MWLATLCMHQSVGAGVDDDGGEGLYGRPRPCLPYSILKTLSLTGRAAMKAPSHPNHLPRPYGLSKIRLKISGCLNLCCFLQSQRLDGLLAQDELLYLATGGQGIGFHELEVTWDFLVADLAFAVLAQLQFAEFGT